jgi:hypothetical protein
VDICRAALKEMDGRGLSKTSQRKSRMTFAKSALSAAVVACALGCSATVANAAQTCHFENGNVNVGAAAEVEGWVTSGAPCGFRFNGVMRDNMQISTPPSHGKAVVVVAQSGVVYQSERGYKGHDSFTVWITFPYRENAAWITYDFDVK